MGRVEKCSAKCEVWVVVGGDFNDIMVAIDRK